MIDQVLNIEQMQHLKELGLDTSKASMVLLYTDDEGEIIEWENADEFPEKFIRLYDAETGDYDHSYRKCCGVFTLQDILDILPVCIEKERVKYELRIKRMIFDDFNVKYAVLYEAQDYVDWYVMQSYSNLLDSLYEMLLLCIQNGFTETK